MVIVMTEYQVMTPLLMAVRMVAAFLSAHQVSTLAVALVFGDNLCVCVHSIISVTVSSDGLVHAMVCVYVHACVRRPGVRSAILQV